MGIGSGPGEPGSGIYLSAAQASGERSIVSNIRKSFPVGMSSPIKKSLESRKIAVVVERTTSSPNQSGGNDEGAGTKGTRNATSCGETEEDDFLPEDCPLENHSW